jgi:hypothetical protein
VNEQETFAMRFRQSLAVSALLLGALSIQGAIAQELSLDPKALDATGAAAKPAAKKAKSRGAAPSAKADDKAKVENRQFGELEGWSPGKAPPKPQPKEEPTSKFGGSAPVSVTPSGGMAVGMPF